MKYDITPKGRENMQQLVDSFGEQKAESRHRSGNGKTIAIIVGIGLALGGLGWLLFHKKPAEAALEVDLNSYGGETITMQVGSFLHVKQRFDETLDPPVYPWLLDTTGLTCLEYPGSSDFNNTMYDATRQEYIAADVTDKFTAKSPGTCVINYSRQEGQLVVNVEVI